MKTKLVYCSICGEKLADDANFCPKCGTKTPQGKTANVVYPSSELREAFYGVGVELEKAFNMAARETQAALQKAKANIQQKPSQPATVCPQCGTKNPSGAIYCNNCGSKIVSAPASAPDEAPHGSA